jgi:excisionase family DNA binding protein
VQVSVVFPQNLPFRSTLIWRANWICLGQSNAEASILLGCSRNHIYRLIERTELAAVQLAIGRSLNRIRSADIEAFIDARPF